MDRGRQRVVLRACLLASLLVVLLGPAGCKSGPDGSDIGGPSERRSILYPRSSSDDLDSHKRRFNENRPN